MAKTITIPKGLSQKDELVVIGRKDLEKITKENAELRSAIRAIFSGELALRKKKTRTFREFLTSEFSRHAKDF
ncbi:MAG: hypothetical protein AAB309_05855 [Deltaproteobacteria bacterium]